MTLNSHLDVGHTLNRLEEAVSPIPIELSLASIAISMQRQAKALEAIEDALKKGEGLMDARFADIRYALNNISNNGQSAAGVAHNIVNRLDTLCTDTRGIADAIRQK